MFFREMTRNVMMILLVVTFTALMVYTGWSDSGQASAEMPAGELPAGELSEVKTRSPIYYHVQRGDCLWSIAKKFKVDIDLLAYANDIDKDSILVENTKLQIPESNKITYTVSEGDTLWGLAQKFNTTIEALVNENGKSITETLKIDQDLTIPVYAIPGDNPAEKISSSENLIGQLDSWPVMGRVSSSFGRRWGRMHEGIDIAADSGEPISAVESGVVAFAGERGSYGNTVIINHGNGFRSLYAHASRLEVSTGDRVEKGHVIARVGSSGRSTGPHLHLELLLRGQPVDPEKYLPNKM